ncbi:MAG: 5-dehydro-4-deoxyglucarate dehydratase [Trueperaceae bacterium]
MPSDFEIVRPGPLAFPVTPFHEDGSLDEEGFERHLSWMLEYDPPALFVACGTGEFASLDEAEVACLVRVTSRLVGATIPIFAGVGLGLPIACRIARAAQEAGAHGLLVLPPYLVTAEQDGLIDYYRQLAEATPLALILYQRDNAVFEPATVARLADLPTVVGFKDGLGDIERMQRIVSALGERLVYFNGMPTAETFQPAYSALGVHRYSSAVFNFVPEVAWAFHSALVKGDGGTVARLLSEFFVPLSNLRRQVKGYAVSLVKAGVAIRRGPVGPVRAPLVNVRSEHLKELEGIIDRGLAAVGVG